MVVVRLGGVGYCNGAPSILFGVLTFQEIFCIVPLSLVTLLLLCFVLLLFRSPPSYLSSYGIPGLRISEVFVPQRAELHSNSCLDQYFLIESFF